jgi:hypothetical protein
MGWGGGGREIGMEGETEKGRDEGGRERGTKERNRWME